MIEDKHLSLVQFAEQYGIAESQLHNWLKREDPPLAKHWPQLAKFFGVSVSYIISGTPEKLEPRRPTGPLVGEEEQAPYGSAESLRAEIRRQVEDVIGLAGDDVGKLGWLREQSIRHMSAPEHWNIHDAVIKKVLAEEGQAGRES